MLVNYLFLICNVLSDGKFRTASLLILLFKPNKPKVTKLGNYDILRLSID
jgi:hypothetical protein